MAQFLFQFLFHVFRNRSILVQFSRADQFFPRFSGRVFPPVAHSIRDFFRTGFICDIIFSSDFVFRFRRRFFPGFLFVQSLFDILLFQVVPDGLSLFFDFRVRHFSVSVCVNTDVTLGSIRSFFQHLKIVRGVIKLFHCFHCFGCIQIPRIIPRCGRCLDMIYFQTFRVRTIAGKFIIQFSICIPLLFPIGVFSILHQFLVNIPAVLFSIFIGVSLLFMELFLCFLAICRNRF